MSTKVGDPPTQIPQRCIMHMRHASFWLIGIAASVGNLFAVH